MNEQHVKTASGLNAAAGLWLILAPFILGFSGILRINDIIFGVLIIVLALVRMSMPEGSVWASWTNAVLGLWIFLSPFFLGFVTMGSIWNNIIVGIIAIALAVWSAGQISSTHQPKAV